MPTAGVDVSSRTHGGGSFAVLFDNELHDWKTSNQANPYFARLGILFGKSRIMFVLEPHGPTAASDFARAHVLVGGAPVNQEYADVVGADGYASDATRATNGLPSAAHVSSVRDRAASHSCG
jgi:hypothetical protein